MTAQAPERRWHLQAWNPKKGLIFDGTCDGDAALGAQMAVLEARRDFRRYAVEPETATNRLTFLAPVGAREPDPAEPPASCRECNLPESECRRREALSGHEFTPAGA